jgi:hypothetical protein
MPFIEAGNRSYLCTGDIIIIKRFPFISSLYSQDPITLHDAQSMHTRHNHMVIQADELGELTVNGDPKNKVHIRGLIYFRPLTKQ